MKWQHPAPFNVNRGTEPLAMKDVAANAATFSGAPNGLDVKLRGQGPRDYGRAARRLPAFEVRDADGVTPPRYR